MRKKVKINQLVIIFCILILATSCTEPTSSGSRSGGRESDVVVVLNREYHKAEPANIVDEYLCDSYLLLPQHEPMFKIYLIAWEDLSSTFSNFRNIIKIDINPKYSEPSAKMNQYDNQVIFNFNAPDPETFVELFQKHAQQVITALNESERKFAADYLKRAGDKNLQKHILNKHQVNLFVQKGFQIRKETDNFLWLSFETNKLSLGLILYYFDYTDVDMFKREYLLKYRDSVLEKHIKGPLYPDRMSYMTTMYDPVAPLYQEMNYKNSYMTEIKGLWRVTEDFMAGPFLSISKPDLDRKRIVTVEGYVYYPSENKRKFMRRFEGALYNFNFPKN